MIILFTSTTHGRPFIREAKRFAADHGQELHIVFSSLWPAALPPTVWTRAKKRLRDSVLEVVWTRRYGVRAHFVEDVNAPEFRAFCAGACGVVASFNQVFERESVLGFENLVNIHASVLPDYRGPNPFRECLAQGEKFTGYTLHRLTEKSVEGPILFQSVFPMADCKDVNSLARRFSHHAATIVYPYLCHAVGGAQWRSWRVYASQVYQSKPDAPVYEPVRV